MYITCACSTPNNQLHRNIRNKVTISRRDSAFSVDRVVNEKERQHFNKISYAYILALIDILKVWQNGVLLFVVIGTLAWRVNHHLPKPLALAVME